MMGGCSGTINVILIPEFETSATKIEVMGNQIKEGSSDNTKKLDEIARLKAELEQRTADNNQEIARLNAEVGHMSAENDRFAANNQKLEEENKKFEGNNNRLKASKFEI